MDQPIEQPDEFHGVGGSYIIDPDTRQRRLAEPLENEQPAGQPVQQSDECHGIGGSYILDPETNQRKPYSGREHLLIKPARPPVQPQVPEDKAEPEKPTPPKRNKKSKRGDK